MREIFQGRDLSVLWYDKLHPSRLPGSPVEGDVDFYLKQARLARGSVLELGCGTGRVALPLAQAGIDVTGLDSSIHMLKLARMKASVTRLAGRLKFVRGDMARFSLPSRYRLAIVPFRAFQHLLTQKTQLACLDSIRRHLKTGGRLIIDLFDPRLDLCHPGKRSQGGVRRVSDPISGRKLAIRMKSRRNDPVLQILRETWEFSLADSRGRLIGSTKSRVSLRWTYRHEMRLLLKLSGFEPLACHGDFRGGPPRYGAEQIWIARKKG